MSDFFLLQSSLLFLFFHLIFSSSSAFSSGYKAHPRNWNILATIVTSKTPTQIRTHAYSVFQRRRRVGTPLPSGFEAMDHSWHRRNEDGDDNDAPSNHHGHEMLRDNTSTFECYQKQYATHGSSMISPMKQHHSSSSSSSSGPRRDAEDPYEQLVMAAIRERSTKWTCVSAMFPPQPPNATRGSGITLSDYLARSLCY